MKNKESVLNRRVSVRTIGALVGSSVAMAVLAGLFYHRRAIKRLIEIRQM